MSEKYVVYNPAEDAYLFCGHSIYDVDDFMTVEDINDATLFNTLDEVWQLFEDYDPILKDNVEPVVIKIQLEVTPNHTVDYYSVKKEIDEERTGDEILDTMKNAMNAMGINTVINDIDVSKVLETLTARVKESRDRIEKEEAIYEIEKLYGMFENNPEIEANQRAKVEIEKLTVQKQMKSELEKNLDIFNPRNSKYL